MSRQDKATTDRHAKILRELVKQPDNKLCADCKKNDPRWASWNLGVFLCIRCSGIHRSMGTHISRVKSVDLDMWTPEQMASVQKWGNRRANIYWEAHLKAGHVPADHKVESFIRSKYESRRWAMDGPPPQDPSVLDQDSAKSEDVPEQVIISDPLPAPRSQSSPVQSNNSRGAHPLLSSSVLASRQAAATPPAATRSPPLVAAARAPAPPAPKPADDLFSLDFHSAPTAASQPGSAPKKAAVNDIMSLFSTPAAAPVPATNNTAWGNTWGAPPPAANAAATSSNDVWGNFASASPVANTTSFFNTTQTVAPGFGASQPAQNIWGASSTTTTQPASGSTGGWGWDAPAATKPTGQPAAKKDDVFGDLWS